MNRNTFLNRIREAAAAGRRFPVHVRDDLDRKLGYAESAGDLVEQFAKELTAVYGRPTIVDSVAASTLDDLPPNVTFISGPSKTGDIEMKLITGVHGPGKFHVLVIDAPGPRL